MAMQLIMTIMIINKSKTVFYGSEVLIVNFAFSNDLTFKDDTVQQGTLKNTVIQNRPIRYFLYFSLLLLS